MIRKRSQRLTMNLKGSGVKKNESRFAEGEDAVVLEPANGRRWLSRS